LCFAAVGVIWMNDLETSDRVDGDRWLCQAKEEPYHGPAQPMQYRPGGLITAQTKNALQSQRAWRRSSASSPTTWLETTDEEERGCPERWFRPSPKRDTGSHGIAAELFLTGALSRQPQRAQQNARANAAAANARRNPRLWQSADRTIELPQVPKVRQPDLQGN
jgi:hypothetical protein